MDVDGDGQTDAVGIVDGHRGDASATVRVLTARGLLTQEVAHEVYSSSSDELDAWYEAADLNGSPGQELVLVDSRLGAGGVFHVLTVVDGTLVNMDRPGATPGEELQYRTNWIVAETEQLPDGDPGSAGAANTSFTCEQDGTLTERLAAIDENATGWTTYQARWKWVGASFTLVDPAGVDGTLPAGPVGPEWSGWYCGNLPRLFN